MSNQGFHCSGPGNDHHPHLMSILNYLLIATRPLHLLCISRFITSYFKTFTFFLYIVSTILSLWFSKTLTIRVYCFNSRTCMWGFFKILFNTMCLIHTDIVMGISVFSTLIDRVSDRNEKGGQPRGRPRSSPTSEILFWENFVSGIHQEQLGSLKQWKIEKSGRWKRPYHYLKWMTCLKQK